MSVSSQICPLPIGMHADVMEINTEPSQTAGRCLPGDLPASLLCEGSVLRNALSFMHCIAMNKYYSTSIACRALSVRGEYTHSQRFQLHALLAGQAGLRQLVNEGPRRCRWRADLPATSTSAPAAHMSSQSVCLLRQWSRPLSQRGQLFLCCEESSLGKAAQMLTVGRSTTALHTPRKASSGSALLWENLCISCARAKQQA